MREQYPIGATWEGIDKTTGMIGRIWLESQGVIWKFWRWAVFYPDGTQKRGWAGGDWGTSYQMCKTHMAITGGVECRMKRINREAIDE
jgi:hypothetical protein